MVFWTAPPAGIASTLFLPSLFFFLKELSRTDEFGSTAEDLVVVNARTSQMALFDARSSTAIAMERREQKLRAMVGISVVDI